MRSFPTNIDASTLLTICNEADSIDCVPIVLSPSENIIRKRVIFFFKDASTSYSMKQIIKQGLTWRCMSTDFP